MLQAGSPPFHDGLSWNGSSWHCFAEGNDANAATAAEACAAVGISAPSPDDAAWVVGSVKASHDEMGLLVEHIAQRLGVPLPVEVADVQALDAIRQKLAALEARASTVDDALLTAALSLLDEVASTDPKIQARLAVLRRAVGR